MYQTHPAALLLHLKCQLSDFQRTLPCFVACSHNSEYQGGTEGAVHTTNESGCVDKNSTVDARHFGEFLIPQTPPDLR